jgi:hypothetical protein
MQQSSSTIPEYLPLNRFARLAQTNRTTLKQQVERGLVKPSAWVADRPVFSLSDLGRVIAELHPRLKKL